MNYLLLFVAGVLLTVGTILAVQTGGGDLRWLFLAVSAIVYSVGLLIAKKAAV